MLDIEKIIQTEIPDIAPVYGGVRGRTMSSRHQGYAWPIIRNAGVKTYIDLREADQSNRLPHLCQLNGLKYFHYPVDNHTRTIAQMVELFQQFCEQIDRGDFYIACAMGLHRTDIALCTYWVFYAADKGIAPHPSVAIVKKTVTIPIRLCVFLMLFINTRQNMKVRSQCQ